ncbi:efflux RND transporter permease subunit [Pseudoalteromonas luteoviolacea]|uniref:efflux RND transporter permease subunit n=1 Tax=Pseudoalteromonas luteoviolacea TaxID=43657 RepID=UPI0011546CFC|nr:efflux RND transporter permease subunit [Pseudoalteromonas luteoviolacea]TQF67345.1 efflux RND transporter permease subunit [Pseudoalteromonas luteoviolacea]
MSSSFDIKEPWYQNPRLILGLTCILVFVGIAGWFSASEQEDPQFPYRNGFIALNANGMTIDQIKDKAVIPIERVLSKIDEVSTFQARIKNGSATVDIELNEQVYNTDTVWHRIKNDISALQGDITPISAHIEDRAQDTQGIVIAITHPFTLNEKRALALKLRTELEQISEIRSVNLVGDPQEQVVIDYKLSTLRDTGISPSEIAGLFANPDGSATTLRSNGLSTHISPIGKIDSIDKIKDIQIALDDQSSIPLSSIADVYYRTNPAAEEQFLINGERVVGLSISLPANSVRVTDVGDKILDTVAQFNKRHVSSPAEIILFQPKWTEQRKSGLLMSLATGCLGVAVILMLMMSVRTAIVVVLSIPAIALSALGVFTAGEGVIHQMTIAGLVLSLGLMVDNSIVMAEKILQLVEQGQTKFSACKNAVKGLYKPLATATITTIAAFLPMLLATGSVADFIASIPVLVILCISFSYLIALTLVPVLAKLSFTHNSMNSPDETKLSKWGQQLTEFTLSRPKTVTSLFLIACVATLFIPKQSGEFFPKTSRNQAYVDIQLPYGSDIAQTSTVTKEVADTLAAFVGVTRTFSFSGSSGPRFYYNLVQQPGESNVARVVFETEEHTDMSALVAQMNSQLGNKYPNILVTARELGQGPPIESPIELRVIGNDLSNMYSAAEKMFAVLNSQGQTLNVRRAYSYGVPQLRLNINEQALKMANMNKKQLSDYVSWQGKGLHASTLQYKTEPMALLVQDTESSQDMEQLLSLEIINGNDEFIPLSFVAQSELVGMKGVETRRNGRTEIRILADVKAGHDEEAILLSLLPELDEIASENNVILKLGGEFEESQEANGALLLALPSGLILLFIALILQFNSYRLTVLVMLSLPLGALGAPAMLALVGVPFGFMSLLGVLALTGIVVNTAILLIDSAVEEIKKGKLKEAAIQYALRTRLRAILLTTVTTIVGMLPLTSSQSPLWPPLAWAVIGGLITSTLLMLIVLPVWMNWLIDPNRYEQRINECNK